MSMVAQLVICNVTPSVLILSPTLSKLILPFQRYMTFSVSFRRILMLGRLSFEEQWCRAEPHRLVRSTATTAAAVGKMSQTKQRPQTGHEIKTETALMHRPHIQIRLQYLATTNHIWLSHVQEQHECQGLRRVRIVCHQIKLDGGFVARKNGENMYEMLS